MASARCAYRGCLRALVLRGGVQRAAVPTFGSGTMVPLRSRKTEPRQASRGAAGEGHDVAQGSNSLPRPDLRKLAQLAKVSLTDEQIEDFQPKVDRVVDWYACDSIYPNYARAAWVLQLADTNNVLTVLFVYCPPPLFLTRFAQLQEADLDEAEIQDFEVVDTAGRASLRQDTPREYEER